MSTIEITDELEAEESITPAVEETPSPSGEGTPSSEHAPSAAGCYGRCELWLT